MGGSFSSRLVDLFGTPRRSRDFLLKRLPPGSVGVELGVYRGDFSARILEVVRPRRLVLVDPWKYMEDPAYQSSLYGGAVGSGQGRMDRVYEGVRARFAAAVAAGTVEVVRATSEEASPRFPDGSLDWVYIDGNHLYPFVKADLETYRAKVRAGGWIGGDDYDRPNSWWKDGVTRAVDEFLAGGRAEKVLVERHQFLLRKPAGPT